MCVLARLRVRGWQGRAAVWMHLAGEVPEREARPSHGSAKDLICVASPGILPAGNTQKCHFSLLENGNQVGRNSLACGMLWGAMSYRLLNGQNGIWYSLGKNWEK